MKLSRLLTLATYISLPIYLSCCTKEEPPKEFVKKPPVKSSSKEESKEKKFVACKLAKSVKKGDPIKKDDFDFVGIEWGKVPYGTVYSSLGVINGIAARDLEKDTIVSYKDIENLPAGASYMMHGTMKVIAP